MFRYTNCGMDRISLAKYYLILVYNSMFVPRDNSNLGLEYSKWKAIIG